MCASCHVSVLTLLLGASACGLSNPDGAMQSESTLVVGDRIARSDDTARVRSPAISLRDRGTNAAESATGYHESLAMAGAGTDLRRSLEDSQPTFHHPFRVKRTRGSPFLPVWTSSCVQAEPPVLPKDEGYGIPVHDPESNAWYVTAQGCLVRLEPDGSKTVVLDDMQARDLDVRARRRLAVSREPEDTIVLHHWEGRQRERKVLLAGPQFFHPRLSPDGSQVLVAESRAGGGHIWLVTHDGSTVDLGKGNGASWHPDGEHIVFTRIAHDNRSLLSSDIFLLSASTHEERMVAHTEAPSAVEPRISMDGKWLAYTDVSRRDAFIVELPNTETR